MSKIIGKKSIIPKSSAPIKSKASNLRVNEPVTSKKNVPIVKGVENANENVTKPVIKSRAPQDASKPMASLSSINLKKMKPNITGTNSVGSSRTKAGPMKATVLMTPSKSNIVAKKLVKESVKKDITKSKIVATPLKTKLTVPPPSAKSHSIMTPVHNVTISSPPPQRKEIRNELVIEERIDDDPVTPRIRERTRTRTLEPHEVVLLQKNLTQAMIKHVAETPPSPDSLEPDTETSLPNSDVSEPIKVKTPVSFEIKFEEPKKPSSNKLNPIEEPTKKSSDSENDDYEDDFESYESDFESEPSINVTSENISDSSACNSDTSEESDNNSATYTKSGTSVENTYKANLDDRKLDSGNYDMDMRAENNSIVDLKTKSQEPLNSVFEENDENNTNDSGLGYFEAVRTPNPTPILTVLQQTTITKPLNTRGYELMQKIHLDEMQFSLFELKPMSYEYYMKIYGNYNSGQNSSQTNDDCMHQEVQTDIKFVKTIWTQNPPSLTKSSLENCHSKSYYYDKNGVGYDTDDEGENQRKHINVSTESEISIEKYNRLNDLLQKALVTISDIIYHKSKKRLNPTAITISNGYRRISSNTIVKIFSSNSFVITVQEENNRNLIFVWNVYSLEMPYRLLSCWSTVECLILLNECILVCGLHNGSLSLWDLREPFYWHSEILNNSNVRIASQIILPEDSNDLIEKIKDYGKVVDLKLMDNDEQVDMLSSYNTIQLCSLHEYGLVTIWTLIENKQSTFDTSFSIPKATSYQNNLSPWRRINLVQNRVLNLHQYFFASEHNPKLSRNKTTFHKTIEYFDNNIFNDKILQELNQTNDDNTSKACDTKNVSYNKIEYIARYGYFVNLSKNYLLFLKKSLKLADILKIFIDTNKLIKCVNFKTISQNKLFIAFLSDGSCKILSILNYLNQFSQNDDSQIGTKTNDSQPSGSGTSVKYHGTNNDMLVASKSCTIQNMIKDERQIYSNEQAINHFDFPEIKIINKNSNNTMNISYQKNTNPIIKTIKLINSNDLKFLLNNHNRNNGRLTLNNFYSFKFNENLILNQFHNILYLYNIETNTQTIVMNSVKNFAVIENLNNQNYLILLVEAEDDVIQIHELNNKLLNY